MRLKNKVVLLLVMLLSWPIGNVYADFISPMPEFRNPQPVSRNPQLNLPYTIKRITDGNSIDYHPEFSSDGKQIVFISKTDNSEKIKAGEFWHRTSYYLNLWIMDSDGNNRRQLTSDGWYDFAPRFTPDGKKILFVSNRRGGSMDWDIWSVNTDGSNLTRLTEIEDREHYPSPTPDGKEVVFIVYKNAHGSVWLMDTDGENARRVTSGGFGDDFPLMSPDGKEIAFKSTRQANGDIWTIDRPGKNYKRLTYEEFPEFYPAWSPDGTKISYVSNKGGAFDVWIMDRDGSNKKKLTQYISEGIWGSKFDYVDLVGIGLYHVSWHPDGTKLALTTWEPDQKSTYLTILDFGRDIADIADELPGDTEPVKEYTLLGERELTNGDWDDFGPSFNPDGKSIVFASNRNGNWDIWRVTGCELRVTGCEPIQLTKSSVDEIAPVYSPDGKEIAFLSATRNSQPATRNTKYSLWVMKSDGSQPKRVTMNIPVLSYPAWSPDGNEIAFVSKGDKELEIWAYNLLDSTRKKVTAIQELENSQYPVFREEKERLTPSDIVKIKELFPDAAREGMMGLTPFTQGETVDIAYPLKEFLYRVDYNTTGDRITFESNRSGNIDIWTVKRDGTELTRITKGNGPHLNPVFSPDGKKIAYARKKLLISSFNEANYNIWVADVESGEEMMINGEEQTDWNPIWSPDGKKIAYVTNRSGDFKHFSIWMLYLK